MKPIITIDLSPHLQDFIKHDFKLSDDGILQINSDSDLGVFIQSMITISDRPPKQELDSPFSFTLPVQAWNHRIFTENFVYIPVWKQILIKNYVSAMFRLRVREYFQIGYEKGFRQEQIINAFLSVYNMRNKISNYDTIKKYDYRSRKKISKEVNESIQSTLRQEI